MKRETSPISTINILTEDDRSIWARFYWSKNSGTYGHQVITEFNVGDSFETAKTNGCGFCKEAAAFSDFCRNVFPDLNHHDFDKLGSSDLQGLMWRKNGASVGRDVEMTLEAFKSLVTN